MTKDQEHLDPRRSLRIERYHTWPKLTRQSTGEHSIQIMRILLALWPEAPRHLLIHCLTHDIGEIGSGDPPYPAKRNNADLKTVCDRIERGTHLAMVIPWDFPPPQILTDTEQHIFKFSEYVEMFEWSIDEIRLGSQEAQLVKERCLERIFKMETDLPREIAERFGRYFKRRMNGV